MWSITMALLVPHCRRLLFVTAVSSCRDARSNISRMSIMGDSNIQAERTVVARRAVHVGGGQAPV